MTHRTNARTRIANVVMAGTLALGLMGGSAAALASEATPVATGTTPTVTTPTTGTASTQATNYTSGTISYQIPAG